MKSRKQIINRIGAVLCALVVLVGCFGNSSIYFADDIRPSVYTGDTNYQIVNNGAKCVVLRCTIDDYVECLAFTGSAFDYIKGENGLELWASGYESGTSSPCLAGYYVHESLVWGRYVFSGMSYTSWKLKDYVVSRLWEVLPHGYVDYSLFEEKCAFEVVYSTCDILDENGNVIIKSGEQGGKEEYDKTIGYLQNVKVHYVFDEVPLGEKVNDKWTSRWYFDSISTTGVDLTSGDYSINYYEERWIVKGYEEEDVVEKSERYLLGTYGAVEIGRGYFSTNSEHIETFLQGQGYEEPGFLELGFNKFVTTHYYLQIVDNSSGALGGYVHIYLTDDNGSFGVELIGDTIDENGNIDDSGYSEFIDEDKITTDDTDAGFTELEENNDVTLEELFEDIKDDSAENLDELDGAQTFNTVGQGYANDVIDVTHGMRATFMRLPDWLLGMFGLSFGFVIMLVLIKSLRG